MAPLNFKQMVNYGWSALAENLKVSRHYWEPVWCGGGGGESEEEQMLVSATRPLRQPWQFRS